MRWYEKIEAARAPDFKIGLLTDPSTLRWHLIPRNAVFNVYLHKWLKSDYDLVLHDHPYVNMSYILEGECVEETVSGLKKYAAGSFNFRRATVSHRILIETAPCWSLFITGPRLNDWGFYCPKGKKPWKEFIEAREAGDPGRGCGEH